MIIGTQGSLHVERDYSAHSDATKDRVKFLKLMNSSLEVIDYGSRVKKETTITVIGLTLAKQIALVDYLTTNIGEKIQLTRENDGEYIFTQYWTPSSFYVKVLSASGVREDEYTPSGETHRVTMNIALTGENIGDKLNADDASLIDMLIQVDTTNAVFSQSGTPAITGTIGERWFNTSDNWVYELTKGDPNTWEQLFEVPADDSTYNFIDGVFYWSSFADISQLATDATYRPDGVAQDHLSGVINSKSLRPASSSISIEKGPNVSHRNGMSFTVNNTQLFWNYVIENGINVLGAKVTFYSYYNDGANVWVKKEFSGINSSNGFGYADFKFNVEPYTLGDKSKFPSNVIANETIETDIDDTDSRYVGIEPDMLGKPAILSYGEFEMGALQDISKEKFQLNFKREDPNGSATATNLSTVTYLIGEINTSNNLEVHVNKEDGGDETKFKFLIEEAEFNLINTSPRDFSLKILSDTHTPEKDNENEVIRVQSFSENSTSYIFTLVSALPQAPTSGDEISFQVSQNIYQHQINEDDSAGFGVTDSSGNFDELTRLYSIIDDRLKEVPNTSFNVIEPGKNLLEVDPSTSSDETAVDVFAKIEPGTPIFPSILTPITNPDFTIQFTNSGGNIEPQGGYNTTNHEKSPGAGGGGFGGFISNPTGKQRYDFCYVPNGEDDDGIRFNYSPILLLNSLTQTTDTIKTFGFTTNSKRELKPMSDNTVIVAMEFPITHDTSLLADYLNQQVRMTLSLDVNWQASTTIERKSTSSHNTINLPAPFELMVRFRNKSGTYVTSSDWEYSVDADNSSLATGVTGPTRGTVRFDNTLEGGGFIEDTTSLDSIYDYVINSIRNDVPDRDSITDPIEGYTVWIEDAGSNEARIDRYSSGNWSTDVQSISLSDSVCLTTRNGIYQKLFTVITGAINDYDLSTVYDQTTVFPLVKYQGKDMFDVSQFFDTVVTWGDLEAMEVLIVSKNFANDYNSFTGDLGDYDQGYIHKKLKTQIRLITAPALYSTKNVEVLNKDLFGPFRGKTLNGTFPTPAKDIVTDIMDTAYPNKWDSDSLDTLDGLSNRNSWVWRKQFLEAKSTGAVLKDLLWNLWAVAVIDADDKISFKSLNPDDYPLGGTTVNYTESDILLDSLNGLQQRDIGDLYQEFKLAFNYYPPSKLSEALQKYRNTQFINEENGGTELSYDLKNSRIITSQINELSRMFDYHYSSEELPMANWIVKWFIFNSWNFKFRLSIKKLLGASPLTMFQYIGVQDFFHTNNDTIEGFVTSLKPNWYEGYVEVKIYCPRPPGYRGSQCDPFNDALFFPSRGDLSSWTEGNGKINSAPDFGGDRTIGVTIKDAGTFPRTITC